MSMTGGQFLEERLWVQKMYSMGIITPAEMRAALGALDRPPVDDDCDCCGGYVLRVVPGI